LTTYNLTKSQALAMVLSPIPATYRLATIPHSWHTEVRYDLSRSSEVNDFHNIWKPTCDFLLMIYSNLGPISRTV